MLTASREGQRATADALRQRLAFDELHHQVGQLALPADVIERADVGVIELGNGVRFVIEAVAEPGIGREHRRHDFDRDNPIEARVLGPIDFAHAALADERQDFVRAKPVAGGQGHCWGLGGIIPAPRRVSWRDADDLYCGSGGRSPAVFTDKAGRRVRATARSAADWRRRSRGWSRPARWSRPRRAPRPPHRPI